jgi:spore coat polysaccharide biosynthesis predicted glycosyltransferase SpsG
LCFPEFGRKILVTLGGADPDNATLRVIEALKQVNIPDLQVKVVVGSANPHLASLQQAVELLPFDLRLLTDVKDMPGLMRWADLAVSAASSTCWELCSLGVPLLSIILAENQVGLAGRLEKSGASKNMGWHYQLDVVGFAEEIRNLLNNEVLRSSLSCHALKLVDGRGSFRVVGIINGG